MLFRRTCFGNHEFTAPSSGSRRRLPGITVAAYCCFAQCKAETVDAERSLPSQHNRRWFPATLVRETIEVFRDRISTGAATTRSAQAASFESLLPHSPLDGFEPPTRVDSAGESAHRAQCLCFQYGNRWLLVMATFRTVLRTVLLKTSELTGADETVRPPSGFQWDMCPATTTETIRLIVIAEALLQSGVG